MSPDDFVAVFAQEVYRSGIEQTLSSLTEPPGRKPASDLVRASEWYRGLDDRGHESADLIIALAAHAVAFGALAVLDGVRIAQERFEVALVESNGQRSLVNGDGLSDLHDRFQTLVMHPDGTLLT